MTKIPADRRYAQTHEWIHLDEDGLARVGITDHAQQQLGDVVFVELPEPGRKVNAGQSCAVIESVKAASDIYSPVSGEITQVNAALADAPESVNQDAYAGWLFAVRLSNAAEYEALLDADAYRALLDAPS